MQGLFYDKAILKSLLSTNEFNESTYNAGVEIDCRKVYTNEEVITNTFEHIISKVKVYTVVPILITDTIDDMRVLSVNELKSLVDGSIMGYKVML